MINQKVYTEIYEILKKFPSDMQKKIPTDFIKMLEKNMDKNYKKFFKVDVNNLKNAQLLDDTKKILSVIYTDYFSTDEEKEVILAKENSLKNSIF